MMSAFFSYLVINVKVIRSTYIYLAVINMQLYFSLISCYENSVISLDCLKYDTYEKGYSHTLIFKLLYYYKDMSEGHIF